MTAVAGADTRALDDAGSWLAPCLDALERAIAAASDLGIAADRARTVLADSRARLGIAPDAYVLALAGGTGVGKSTLLNSIAASTVSAAGVRRPTTGRPVAWVARSTLPALRPLLERLDVAEVRTHDAEWARQIVVLDLPDLDSIDDRHRAVVDEILPRVDAVAWVVDPEKYADAALHLGYLRPMAERFARQALVVNKADLLEDREVEEVRSDARRRLVDAGIDGAGVLVVSALAPDREPAAVDGGRGTADGEPGAVDGERNGLLELRTWLAQGADAKRVIAERVAADVRSAVQDLARRAGVETAEGRPDARLVGPDRRSNVAQSIEAAALRLIDLQGLRRQAVGATRQEARAAGTGPAGFITSRLYHWSGLKAAGADPAGYLRSWRRRGSLAAAVASVGGLPGSVLAGLPPEARPAVAAAVAPALAAEQADAAIDDAIRSLGDIAPARSRLWPVFGVAQSIVAADLLGAALWLVALWLSHAGSGSAMLPVVGPVPWPFALLVGGLVAGFLLARLLALHAGWIGSRWADGLARRVSSAVAERVSTAVLQPLDVVEGARASLAVAVGEARGCASSRSDGAA